MFCIARAILSKTQILVLDEATAAVDLQTDKLIQDTIKVNFANLTVLTIAHRLNTIMESDKILVMDAGRVMEFAPPLALLDRPDGHFYSLLKETGKDSFNKLKKIAEDKAARNPNAHMLLDPYSDPDNIIIDPKTNENIVAKNRSLLRSNSGNHSAPIATLTVQQPNVTGRGHGIANPGFVQDLNRIQVVAEPLSNRKNLNDEEVQVYHF